MRLLLDSHALLWALFRPDLLSEAVAVAIREPTNDVIVDPLSIYELELKKSKGKLPFPDVADWESVLSRERYRISGTTTSIAQRASRLPRLHNDPWDRLLVAHALDASAALASKDSLLRSYGVDVLW